MLNSQSHHCLSSSALRVALGIVLTISGASSVPGARDDYTVGPDDVLRITIADAPELGGTFRVTPSGELTIAGLPSPLKVLGKTTASVAALIAQEFRNAELLVSPLVSVSVEQYNSRSVTVMGAVGKPSVYPLQRPMTLLEVISTAGGLLPTAGEKLTVLRKKRGDSQADTSAHVISINIPQLMRGEDPALNIYAETGDVLDVTPAPVVYVIGAVMKPGGFVCPASTSKFSVLQALALAEGIKPAAAADRALIIRQSSSQGRQEIPVHLNKFLTAKLPDQLMEPNDILFVPESSIKKGLKTMGAIAVQTISGVTIYGVGYRAAGLR